LEWSTDIPIKAIMIKEIPWWYRTSIERPIDTEAADDLLRILSMDDKKPVYELLRLASTSRQSETAALAMRTRFLFGDYSGVFGTDGMLSQSTSRPHRALLLNSLFQSMGFDAKHFLGLKESIEQSEPERAHRLVSLLALPNDAQLADGADRLLVESLGSPFLDERILAIRQLQAILGKELGFQSDRPSVESIQQWKKLLNAGKIRWPKGQ
jgi:hypothetical protein